MKPKITVNVTKIIQTGDLALVNAKWTLKGTGPDGKEVNLNGRSTEILRKQPDGTWRFVIDDPYSAD